MNGVAAVAAAVLASGTPERVFPAEGVVRKLFVTRDSAGRIASLALDVSVGDELVDECGWSGPFAAEIDGTSDNGASLVGRRVRVELSGGQPLVAYTVNGSGIL